MSAVLCGKNTLNCKLHQIAMSGYFWAMFSGRFCDDKLLCFGSRLDRPKTQDFCDIIAKTILRLGIRMKYMSRFMIDQVNWFENVFERNLCVSMDAV